MKKERQNRGALTVEACLAYPIFLMVIVTLLYVMRIVYAYGLIQHAVAQTAKELSMYTYLYQVTGLNDAYQDLKGSAAARTEQFNQDAANIVELYEVLQSGSYSGQTYSGTVNPEDILKNVGSALVSEASAEANQLLFETIVRPMIAGYIGADAEGNSAEQRLMALRVVGGLEGLNLSSSSFFEDGVTIDLVACYTIDPLMPIDILPELNLMSRACVRGMAGKNVFSRSSGGGESEEKEKSVWDMESDVKRGKAIQEQQKVRNLPDNFSVYSAYDASTGKATAERSIDLRETSYQTVSGIKGAIRSKCNAMENYKKTTYAGVTLDPEDIRSKELILYIPSSKEGRKIDRSSLDQAVREIKGSYPDIQITVKEID